MTNQTSRVHFLQSSVYIQAKQKVKLYTYNKTTLA